MFSGELGLLFFAWLQLAQCSKTAISTSLHAAIDESGPYITFSFGTLLANRAICNNTWVAAAPASELGIGPKLQRQRRVSSRQSAAVRKVGHSCALLQDTVPLESSRGPTHRGTWQVGPGLAAAEPSTQPAVMAGNSGCSASLSSPQEAPSLEIGTPVRQSALHPPTRSVEPWSVEYWFWQFAYPSQRDNQMTGGLFGSSYATYRRVPKWHTKAERKNLAFDTPEWGWAPMDKDGMSASTFVPYNVMRHGMHALFRVNLFRRELSLTVPMTVCKKNTLSSACTPMNGHIVGNDTCRQQVDWARATDSQQLSPGATNTSSCSSRFPADGGVLANVTQFPASDYDSGSHIMTAVNRVRHVSLGNNEAVTARTWNQVLHTVYPPYTVAEAPVAIFDTKIHYQGNDALLRARYAWRRNPHHVTQVTNGKGTSVFLHTGYDRMYASCDWFPPSGHRKFRPGYPKTLGMLVFLDDPSCVESTSCRPKLQAGVLLNSTEYVNGTMEWIKAYLSKPPYQRDVQLGCSPAYLVNGTEWNVDLVHFDYPAATSGRAATIGGIGMNFWPSIRGRWNSSNVPLVPRDYSWPISRRCLPLASPADYPWRCMPPADVPWSLPYDISPIVGPIAVYRGSALHRVRAPPINVSLPPINGGGWRCQPSFIDAAFQGRPACRAYCTNPSHIAVDHNVEAWSHANRPNTGEFTGWLLAASVSRVWWSFWTGKPGLLLDESLVPRGDRLPPFARGKIRKPDASKVNPPLYRYASRNVSWPAHPEMRCVRDVGGGLNSWRYGALWAQREAPSKASVVFVLRFDRNGWPASITDVPTRTTPPGLAYPIPSRQQLAYVYHEIEQDIRDVLAEWSIHNSTTSSVAANVDGGYRHIGVTVESAGPATPHEPLPLRHQGDNLWARAAANDCVIPTYVDTDPPELPMELNVSVIFGQLPGVRFLGMQDQRMRSPGAVAQRLALLLRQGPGVSGGGRWLGAAVERSVQAMIELPCLRGGYGSSATDCGGGLQHIGASPSVWWVVSSAMLAVACYAGIVHIRAAVKDSAAGQHLNEWYSGSIEDRLLASDESDCDSVQSFSRNLTRTSSSLEGTYTNAQAEHEKCCIYNCPWCCAEGPANVEAPVRWLVFPMLRLVVYAVLFVGLVQAQLYYPALVLGLGLSVGLLVRHALLLLCGATGGVESLELLLVGPSNPAQRLQTDRSAFVPSSYTNSSYNLPATGHHSSRGGSQRVVAPLQELQACLNLPVGAGLCSPARAVGSFEAVDRVGPAYPPLPSSSIDVAMQTRLENEIEDLQHGRLAVEVPDAAAQSLKSSPPGTQPVMPRLQSGSSYGYLYDKDALRSASSIDHYDDVPSQWLPGPAVQIQGDHVDGRSKWRETRPASDNKQTEPYVPMGRLYLASMVCFGALSWESSSIGFGDLSTACLPARPGRLQQHLARNAAISLYFRLTEDACVLASVVFCLMCVIDACPWRACAMGLEDLGQLRMLHQGLVWEQRAYIAGAPLLASALIAMVSICMALYDAWRYARRSA